MTLANTLLTVFVTSVQDRLSTTWPCICPGRGGGLSLVIKFYPGALCAELNCLSNNLLPWEEP